MELLPWLLPLFLLCKENLLISAERGNRKGRKRTVSAQKSNLPWTTTVSISHLFFTTKQIKNGQLSSRIVNGDDVSVGRYPYLVSLQTTAPKISHRCGGALIGKIEPCW
jgi:hypothetical protein